MRYFLLGSASREENDGDAAGKPVCCRSGHIPSHVCEGTTLLGSRLVPGIIPTLDAGASARPIPVRRQSEDGPDHQSENGSGDFEQGYQQEG
ncbi:hypothetical protein ADT71_24670 [Novosphingobium sp. ST904]|nr:hypothetical protein ADT71_24670 [Novosphingobium sp. ST904]